MNEDKDTFADNMNKIFASILKQIKPTDKKLLSEVNSFLKNLNSELKKNKINATAVVGGSIAKDTYLAKDYDCDIFVRFDKSYKNEDISSILLKTISKLKPEIIHGSRDYFHVKKKINYELVPVLEIKSAEDAVNVTDMSPLHVQWVAKHPGFNDQIRLAKQFCKACGVYGAESYIRGFSGHVLDILVIHYGGFLQLLSAAINWKNKEVIDPEKYYEKDALEKLNKSKIESPLIIIDPVYSQRNAAAALSYEKIELFKQCAKEFINSPDIKFFTIKQKTISSIKKEFLGKKLIILDIESFEGKEDVIGAKILKAYQQIINQIKFYDFEIISSGWNWDKNKKSIFWFVFDKKELVSIKKWIGPPVAEKERIEHFKEKYKKIFVENGRVCTYVKRRYTKPEDLIFDIVKNDNYLYEKIKKAKIIRSDAK